MAQAIAEEYTTSLEDLTFNSKPHINALTMLAEEYSEHADVIVHVIEAKLEKALPNCKLPIMYLMDSIVKNVGGNYKPLFAKNIVKSFASVFQRGDEKIKMSLYKLRSTWDNYFPLKRLYELDVSIRSMDSNWPVKPLPASLQEKSSSSIHINPKFIKKVDGTPTVTAGPSTIASKVPNILSSDSADLKQDLINKQKQLLELQQQKLLLELEQTKQQLALREKKSSAKKQATSVTKDPRVKPTATPAAAQANLRVTLTNGKKQDQVPARDPRTVSAATKSRTSAALGNPKKTGNSLNVRVKADEHKKVDPEKPKLAAKKAVVTEKTDKKKAPNNLSKSNLPVKSNKSSSKTTKPEPVKKGKIAKKKSEVKAAKRPSDENRKDDTLKPIVKNEFEKEKLLRDVAIPKDRLSKRSPPRLRPPPAKQPRHSTSVERARSPPRREINASGSRHRHRPTAIKEDLKRFSPSSAEGSISPRFSPEPEEPPLPHNEDFRPLQKRIRQEGYMHHPGPAHMMLPAVEGPGIRRRTSVDPNLTIPQELSLGHQAEILKQAEIQLQTGQLTHSQHQDLLKQLHQLFELQRLRTSIEPEHERHRSPLEELIPKRHPSEAMRRHGEDFIMQRPPHFNKEVSFRPLSPPPMMEEGRDIGYRRDPRERHLTPPPLPPIDPRRDRRRPPPQDNRVRLERERRENPRVHGYRDDREHPRSPRDRNVERRPSPNRRRPSAGWDEMPPMHRSEIGEDVGNVFVMEEDTAMPAPRHHEIDKDDNSQELQNNNRTMPHGVPLRAYAEKDQFKDKRNSFEETSSDQHHPPSEENRLTVQESSKVESDNEYDGPQLEEPEDYIIANIPPGAEAYHEHSMKLKRSGNVPANVIANRRLSDAATTGGESDTMEDRTGSAENTIPEASMSPDASMREKLEDLDDVNKSPSLPLKKRKYIVSSAKDGVDTGEETADPEPDLETTEKEQVVSVSEKPKIEDDDMMEGQPMDDEVDKQSLEIKDIDNKVVEKMETEDSEPKPDENTVKIRNEDNRSEQDNEVKNSETKEDDANQITDHEQSANVSEKDIERDSETIPAKTTDPEKPTATDGTLGGDEKVPSLASDNMQEQKKKKRRKKQQQRNRRGQEEDMAKMEEERRIKQLMMEEEERMRWEAELEMELGREAFQEIHDRERRVIRASPPRRMWGRHDGPWRGRGPPPPPPPPGRGRRWRMGELWDDDPHMHFPGRPPIGRLPPPPRRPMDDREWDRPWEDRERRRRHPPMTGPRDERLVDRDWPPRGPGFGGSPNHPPPPQEKPQPQPEINQVNVNKLLDDLLSMGIIPGPTKSGDAEKRDEITEGTETPKSNDSSTVKKAESLAGVLTSSQEELSKKGHKLEETRVATPVFDDLLAMDPNNKLPNIALDDIEKLKIRHEEVVARLYTGIQCSACGMRFTACQTDMYAEHLDWHYRLNRKDKDGIRETYRRLYPSAGEWIMYEEIIDPNQRAKSQVFEEIEDGEGEMEEQDMMKDNDEHTVPVAKNPEQDKCAVCNEAFKTVYNDEEEEWQYVGCVAVEDKNFHPACYADHNDRDSVPPPTPVRVPIYNPLGIAAEGIPGLDTLSKDAPSESEKKGETEGSVPSPAIDNKSIDDSVVSDVKVEASSPSEAVVEDLSQQNEGNQIASESSNEMAGDGAESMELVQPPEPSDGKVIVEAGVVVEGSDAGSVNSIDERSAGDNITSPELAESHQKETFQTDGIEPQSVSDSPGSLINKEKDGISNDDQATSATNDGATTPNQQGQSSLSEEGISVEESMTVDDPADSATTAKQEGQLPLSKEGTSAEESMTVDHQSTAADMHQTFIDNIETATPSPLASDNAGGGVVADSDVVPALTAVSGDIEGHSEPLTPKVQPEDLYATDKDSTKDADEDAGS